MNKETLMLTLGGVVVGVVATLLVTNGTDQRNQHAAMMESGKQTSHIEMSMSDMTTALQDKKGDEFDKAFIEMMIAHHQGAIDMANLIPGRAKHEEIKKLGQDIVSAQTREINEMKKWANLWGYTK